MGTYTHTAMGEQLTCGQHICNYFKEIPLSCKLMMKPFADFPAGPKGLLSCSQEDNKAALGAWILFVFWLGLFDLILLLVVMILTILERPDEAGFIIGGFILFIIVGACNSFLWTHTYHYWLIRYDACCCGSAPNPILWAILGFFAIAGGLSTILQNLSNIAVHWSYIFAVIGNIIHGVPLIYMGVLDCKIYGEKKNAKVAPGAVGA